MKFYKNILTIILTLALFTNVYAQIDRSVKPEAGPAPKIEIGEHQSFTMDNGLEVIVVENHKIPKVSFQLTVDVDPVKQNEAVGYVSMTGNLLRNGTKNNTKQEIDQAIDFIGADLYTYENGIYGSVLKKHMNKYLDVMSDVLLNPIFPEDEIAKAKKQSISGLASSKTDANAIAGRLAKKLRYGKHPYGELETEKTLENITRDLCANYYNTYYRPNVSYLVIVGDINLKEVKELSKKYFASWEKANVPTHKYDFPKEIKGTRVAFANKDDAVQSIISITYPINLKQGDKDEIPAKVTNSILGGGVFSGNLMKNLREDKGYTYGARSRISIDPLVGYFKAGAQVATQVTDSAVTEFLYEMNRMNTEEVTEEHLQLIKNVTTGTFARSLESPRTIARFALNTELYNLDKDYYKNYLETLNNVTVSQVSEMSDKYITTDKSFIIVVGDKKVLAERLKKFSYNNTIEMYDFNGNIVKESAALPEGITAEKVIANYIDAIGGRENIKKVEDFTMLASATMNGMTLNMNTYQKVTGEYAMEVKMNGNVMQKQMYNGEVGKVSGMQGNKEITGDDLEALKLESKMNKFLDYEKCGITIELDGIEAIDGNNAYKIKLVKPDGSKSYDYYDVKSGLKIQNKATTSTPRGDFTQVQVFSDYKEVKGVKYPFVISTSGMQNITLKVKSIKINEGIEDSMFE